METHKSNSKNWHTILSLGLSGLGIAYFLIQSLSLGVLWIVNFSSAPSDLTQIISYGLLFWSSIFSGLVLVPLFILSLFQLQGKAPPKWLVTEKTVIRKISFWLFLLWPIIVMIGWFVAGRPMIAAVFLGLINILVAGLPILWIYIQGSKDLKRVHPLDQWRIFGFSLTITPVIIIIVEIIILLMLAGFGLLYISYRTSMDPSFERDLVFLSNQVSIRQNDLDAVLEIIKPYMFQPSMIVWGLVIFAGVIPVVEEMIKPLALWSMAGRRISPQEGFVGGLLCGAGFALMENVLYFTATFTAMDWLILALGRAGTGVLHILASGLIGWGLARAWRDGKWVFLGITSFAAIVLHGLWNAVSLATGVAALLTMDSTLTIWQNFLYNAPTLIIFFISVIVMIVINRHFMKRNLADPAEVEVCKPGNSQETN